MGIRNHFPFGDRLPVQQLKTLLAINYIEFIHIRLTMKLLTLAALLALAPAALVQAGEYCSWNPGSRVGDDAAAFDDPNHYGFESPDPWCGNDGDLSCTPFYYKLWTYENFMKYQSGGQDPDWCDTEPGNTLTGNAFGTNRAWAHFKDGKLDDNSFFVFHGRDGAGEMPDCVGDVKYVERIGPISGDQNTLWCEDGITVNEIPNAPYNPRRRCEFRHPGLGKVYSDYAAGSSWNTYGANDRIPEEDFKSAASGGWSPEVINALNEVAYNPFQEDNAIGFMIFPWVCTTVCGVGKKGCDDTNKVFNTEGVENVKCYWDNERGDDGTPLVQLYWGIVRNDGEKPYLDMKGWYYEKNQKQMVSLGDWTMNICNDGDGCFNIPLSKK